MIEKTYKVYTFDELSEEAQQKAITDNYDMNVEYWEWYHHVYDDYEEKLHAAGYDTRQKDIQFSGFSSQGDGASFDGTLDLMKYIIDNKLEKEYPVIAKMQQDGYISQAVINTNNYSTHYCHEKTRYIEIDDDTYTIDSAAIDDGLEAEWQKLEERLEEERLELCNSLYEALQAEYEHLTSDDTIRAALIENEYHFTSNGKIDHHE